MEGANGIDSSLHEFRALLSKELQRVISENQDMSLTDRMKLQLQLAHFYASDQSVLEQRRVKFSAKSDPLQKFMLGFPPLDTVLGGNGITAGVITLIAVPGSLDAIRNR